MLLSLLFPFASNPKARGVPVLWHMMYKNYILSTGTQLGRFLFLLACVYVKSVSVKSCAAS